MKSYWVGLLARQEPPFHVYCYQSCPWGTPAPLLGRSTLSAGSPNQDLEVELDQGLLVEPGQEPVGVLPLGVQRGLNYGNLQRSKRPGVVKHTTPSLVAPFYMTRQHACKLVRLWLKSVSECSCRLTKQCGVSAIVYVITGAGSFHIKAWILLLKLIPLLLLF